MSHDVFISYSSKDKLVADAICASLEANKIKCWFTPRDILPGQDWAESIEDAITKSKIFILIFSSYSNDSKQISREISLAFNSEVTVIPFRIEDIEPKGAMKYYLLNTHWQDALTPPLENNINKLVEVVSKFIGKRVDEAKEESKESEQKPGKLIVSEEEKPEDREIKTGPVGKLNKKKLAIILGAVGTVVIATAIILLIKFPINKAEKVVETTAVEITVAAETTAETTATETTSSKTTETTVAVETTSLQNESVLSAINKITFATDFRTENNEIYTMDSDGLNQKMLTDNDAEDLIPCFSPDGSKIVFLSYRDGNEEVYIMNSDGSNQKNLSNSEGVEWFPRFSPDGSKIIFASDRDGPPQIYTINIDGSNLERLTYTKFAENMPCFSPDGSKIVYNSNRGDDFMYAEIYIMDSDGMNQQRLTDNEVSDFFPCFSPDGSKIVYVSNPSLNPLTEAVYDEIYIMNSDGSNQQRLTDNEFCNRNPCFFPDGSKILFATGRDEGQYIYIMDIDGSNQQRLLNDEIHTLHFSCFFQELQQ
jgi:TolB protein